MSRDIITDRGPGVTTLGATVGLASLFCIPSTVLLCHGEALLLLVAQEPVPIITLITKFPSHSNEAFQGLRLHLP
jgi:hypothetical protein